MNIRNILKRSIPSYLFLKIQYKKVMGKKLNLREPITFNEKLQWLKLYDRRKEYTFLVDKYKVKEIVGAKIGKEYLIPTLGYWSNFELIDFGSLPNQFVLKCTHDSGGVIICKNKKDFNFHEAQKKIDDSFGCNFFYMSREWPYKNVVPKIIAEEFISDNLSDYKFFCFNGEVKIVLVCRNRYTKEGLTEDFFDTDWKHLNMSRKHHPNSTKDICRPEKLDEMINLAEILSENIPFVRVDLYEVDGKVYFGELTFFPASGLEGFVPECWDKTLGEWLILPEKNKFI
ncbi:glycosyl transferase [Enterococcus casseliflavus]|uniref:ATP-grasp fold amidoligase family protein n=2 Tax=Enterococcus TaxID=1350 RepID=UPI001C7022EE|nr:ATP-grasp fold amidoligase family protein [Enterococcus innesii]MBW9324173.1 glycosyl transferase [Enterococcus casseliflavus]MEB5951042.1 glycosyl transferase [Enterococcus innesii]